MPHRLFLISQLLSVKITLDGFIADTKTLFTRLSKVSGLVKLKWIIQRQTGSLIDKFPRKLIAEYHLDLVVRDNLRILCQEDTHNECFLRCHVVGENVEMFVQLGKARQGVYFVLGRVKLILVTVLGSPTLEMLLGDGEHHGGLERHHAPLVQGVSVEPPELDLLATLDIGTPDRPLGAHLLVLGDLGQPHPDLAPHVSAPVRHLLYEAAHDAVGEAGAGGEGAPAGGAEADLLPAALADDVTRGAGGDRQHTGDQQTHRALQTGLQLRLQRAHSLHLKLHHSGNKVGLFIMRHLHRIYNNCGDKYVIRQIRHAANLIRTLWSMLARCKVGILRFRKTCLKFINPHQIS